MKRKTKNEGEEQEGKQKIRSKYIRYIKINKCRLKREVRKRNKKK
jgi:hypothetical protein